MRLPNLLLLLGPSVLATACLADVGGDECVGSRCQSTPDGGSTAASCNDPEIVTGNLTLRTASDFDALPTGCWELNANLRVEGTAITSLARLGELAEVNDLELVDTGLTTIDTRRKVKVWGSLLASGNRNLTNLNNLAVKRWDGLTAGGSWSVAYTIRNNASLTAIDGLKYIQHVDRGLTITENAKLATIELPELATVNGDLVLRANPALTTIGSMSALTQIGGALTIDDNDALVDLTTLTNAMTRITGAVTISNNANLTGVGQLGHLTGGIGATVVVTSNPKLPSCKAIEIDHCVQSGAVTVQNNLGATTSCTCWCGL